MASLPTRQRQLRLLVILAVQSLKEHLDRQYRKRLDVLREMPRVANLRGLMPATLANFSTVCASKPEIPMKRWRAILDQTVELYDLGEVRGIDATGMDRVQAN